MEKKIFTTLFLAVFANITGVGIVVPLLPVYAKNLGASGFYIGLIFGAFSLSRTFLLPLFGKLSDKHGRKPFITTGLFAYFLVSIAFIFTNTVSGLIFIRFLHGAASAMLLPVIQAYVGDLTKEGKEGITMGIFNISMFTSLSLGPLLGGFINDKFSLEYAFLSMGMFALFAFFLSVIFLPKTSDESIRNKAYKPYKLMKIMKNKVFAGLAVFRFSYTTCIGIIWCFLPVYADQKFSMNSTLIGILVMSGVFTSGIMHAPIGYLSDKMNKKVLVFTGGIICAIGLLLTGFGTGFYSILGAVIIFGLGGGISMPSIMALAVIHGKNENAMGGVMSLLTVAHSLGMLAGSVLAGIIMDLRGLKSAFPTGFAIMITGTFIFLYLDHVKKTKDQQTEQ
jgi:MFS family permease